MGVPAFISYSHKDKKFAADLQSRLKAANIDGWMDNRLSNGEFWRPEIDRRLKDALIVIVVVSPCSMRSAYVTYEWCYAWFNQNLDLNDLYWIYLHECRDKRGMFGRITDDVQFPFDKLLHGNPTPNDWNTVINEIKERLEEQISLSSARNTLIKAGESRENKQIAAHQLGQAQKHKSKACSYLLQGIEPQLNSHTADGKVQTEIASALQKVGDLRAIPFLLKLKEFTTDRNVLAQVDSAIGKLVSIYT